MKTLTLSLLALSLLTLSNCSSLPEPNDTKVVRFALRDDYVTSWEPANGGIVAQLNNEGKRKLTSLTRNNPGSEMEFYAGRIFLGSQTIGHTLRGDNLFVTVDDDVMELALAQMPHGK